MTGPTSAAAPVETADVAAIPPRRAALHPACEQVRACVAAQSRLSVTCRRALVERLFPSPNAHATSFWSMAKPSSKRSAPPTSTTCSAYTLSWPCSELPIRTFLVHSAISNDHAYIRIYTSVHCTRNRCDILSFIAYSARLLRQKRRRRDRLQSSVPHQSGWTPS